MVTIWAQIEDALLFGATLKKGKMNTHACLIWIRRNEKTLMRQMVFQLIRKLPVHLVHLGAGAARILATFVLLLFSTGNIVKPVFFRFCPIV